MKRVYNLSFIFLIIIISCKKDNKLNETTAADCSILPYRIGSVIKSTDCSNENPGNSTTSTTTIFDADTIVNNLRYVGIRPNSPDNRINYLRVDKDGNLFILNTNKVANGTDETDLLFIKNNTPVGTIWSWGKYKFKVLSTTQTFAFDGETYSNGIAVEESFEYTYDNNIYKRTATTTYFCGIGFAETVFFDSRTLNQCATKLLFYQY
jgi:hypothetical protein